MMQSGDHTVQPPSNTTPHQPTQQQHQQNNYMYRTSAQQAMNTFPPPPPPATPQTHSIAQPHQLHKYGPARTHGQQPQTSPYTPNTASMSHTKAPTTTGQQTATPKQNHPAPNTPQVQHAAQPQAPTPTSTQTTPIHTPTAPIWCDSAIDTIIQPSEAAPEEPLFPPEPPQKHSPEQIQPDPWGYIPRQGTYGFPTMDRWKHPIWPGASPTARSHPPIQATTISTCFTHITTSHSS